MSPTRIKIIIVEDHPHYLNGISQFIASNLKNHEVTIDSAKDGSSAIKLLATKNFDIAIIDLGLPDMTGIELIEHIRRRLFKTKLIVNSYEYNLIQLNELCKHDVESILMKGDDEHLVIESIQKVLSNQKFYSSSVNEQIEKLNENMVITKTEKHVLELLCKGYKTEQIATEKNISLNTVNTHKKHIFNKLKVHNAAELAAIATKLGLV